MESSEYTPFPIIKVLDHFESSIKKVAKLRQEKANGVELNAIYNDERSDKPYHTHWKNTIPQWYKAIFSHPTTREKLKASLTGEYTFDTLEYHQEFLRNHIFEEIIHSSETSSMSEVMLTEVMPLYRFNGAWELIELNFHTFPLWHQWIMSLLKAKLGQNHPALGPSAKTYLTPSTKSQLTEELASIHKLVISSLETYSGEETTTNRKTLLAQSTTKDGNLDIPKLFSKSASGSPLMQDELIPPMLLDLFKRRPVTFEITTPLVARYKWVLNEIVKANTKQYAKLLSSTDLLIDTFTIEDYHTFHECMKILWVVLEPLYVFMWSHSQVVSKPAFMAAMIYSTMTSDKSFMPFMVNPDAFQKRFPVLFDFYHLMLDLAQVGIKEPLKDRQEYDFDAARKQTEKNNRQVDSVSPLIQNDESPIPAPVSSSFEVQVEPINPNHDYDSDSDISHETMLEQIRKALGPSTTVTATSETGLRVENTIQMPAGFNPTSNTFNSALSAAPVAVGSSPQPKKPVFFSERKEGERPIAVPRSVKSSASSVSSSNGSQVSSSTPATDLVPNTKPMFSHYTASSPRSAHVGNSAGGVKQTRSDGNTGNGLAAPDLVKNETAACLNCSQQHFPARSGGLSTISDMDNETCQRIMHDLQTHIMNRYKREARFDSMSNYVSSDGEIPPTDLMDSSDPNLNYLKKSYAKFFDITIDGRAAELRRLPSEFKPVLIFGFVAFSFQMNSPKAPQVRSQEDLFRFVYNDEALMELQHFLPEMPIAIGFVQLFTFVETLMQTPEGMPTRLAERIDPLLSLDNISAPTDFENFAKTLGMIQEVDGLSAFFMAVLLRSSGWKRIEKQIADNDAMCDIMYDQCIDAIRNMIKSGESGQPVGNDELEFTLTSPMWLVRTKGYHICHDLSLFDPKSFKKDNRPTGLVERVQKLATQHKKPINPAWVLKVEGVGDVRLKLLNNTNPTAGDYKIITIKDVFYVPSMRYNVLSLSAGGINKMTLADPLAPAFSSRNQISIAVPNTSKKKRSDKTAPLYISFKLEIFHLDLVPFIIDYTHFGGNGNHDNRELKEVKISALEIKAPLGDQLTGIGDVVMI
jgi:hypothetical protein